MSNATLNAVRNFVQREKPNWPKIKKFIGGGANGRVYELENGRMLKIIYDAAHQEYDMLNRLKGLRIAPSFKEGDSVIVRLSQQDKGVMHMIFPGATPPRNRATMFIMGKVGGNQEPMTLWKYLTNPKHKHIIQSNKARIQARISHLIEQMHLRGVSHGDLHSGNILVTVSPSGYITGMWVIDFGRSRHFPRSLTERTLLNSFAGMNDYKERSVFNKHGRSYEIPLFLRSGGAARKNINMGQVMYNLNLRSKLEGWNKRRIGIEENLALLPRVRKPVGDVRRARTPSPRRSTPKLPTRPRSATRWSPPRPQRKPLAPLNIPRRKTPSPPKGCLGALCARFRPAGSGRGRSVSRTTRRAPSA